jgi:hypothetical protein
MRRFVLAAIALGAFGVGGALGAVGSGGQAAEAARAPGLTPLQQRLASGAVRDAMQDRTAARVSPQLQALAQIGPTDLTGCPANRGSNVQVNQDCQNVSDPDLAGRGQAQNETAVAQDPSRPERMVAAANDYRRGDSNCHTSYSSDSGRSWKDSSPPTSFTRGDAFGGFPRKYWQAAGDPTVAWDTKGNAYLTCLFFDRGGAVSQNPAASSAFYVFRSTGTGGGSWNFPGRPVAESSDPTGGGEAAFLDKELMTIDNHRGSRFQDRIYVSWTRFDPDGTSYIYLAYSRDYGEHFSPPKLVSRDSALCPLNFDLPVPQGACNVNQFSQPFTGSDGTLYVTWANYNTTGLGPRGEDRAAPSTDNRAQILLARSTDGGNSFSAPVRVGDFYDLPDCATYQDGKGEGVSCIPEKGETSNSIFRATNYPVGGVNPADAREVMVTFGSYLNRHSRESNGCVPQGFNPDTLLPLYKGVKTRGACNNDIVVSRSRNRGQSFTGSSTNVRQLPAARESDPRADQFWQWAAFNPAGRLAVSYYDRAYGNDELTGFSDVSLSGSRNGSAFRTVRVTSAAMPPPTQFEAGFFGDYSALSADDTAHPVWMDTRDPELFVCRDSAGTITQPPALCPAAAPNAAVANDQNINTRSLPVPLP